MTIHSSILVWRIPWTEEPGRLQSLGLHRVGPTEWLTYVHTHSDSEKYFISFLKTIGIFYVIASKNFGFQCLGQFSSTYRYLSLHQIYFLTLFINCAEIYILETIFHIFSFITDAEEAGVDRFCEDLQYLLELIPKRKEFLDAFELWSQRRLLRDPWTSRR